MKVSKLTDNLLDTHVAQVLGWQFRTGPAPGDTPECGHGRWFREPGEEWHCATCRRMPRRYSQDWSHGGPVIELLRLELLPPDNAPHWFARAKENGRHAIAINRYPLRAAMEALVLSRNPHFEA